MGKVKISIITLFAVALLLFLHLFGTAYHLYMTYWFYDVILHFLGGVSICLSVFCISEILDIKLIKYNMWSLIILTLIAGIAWELFELYYDIAGYVFGTTAYTIDTIKDLIMDTLGGYIVYFIIKVKNL